MKGKTFQFSGQPLQGVIEIPGDKSISHRAVIFGSLAQGTTEVSHFLDGEDCLRTVAAFEALGVTIEKNDKKLIIKGKGIKNLHEPEQPIYFGNSGTTARLMIGLLAGLPFFTTVYGDPSLTKRPMERVVTPLLQMGAHISGRKEGNFLPLAIKGTSLSGITYELPVKSAQVKSALLLAGLLADGETTIIEKAATRDHTEKMLQAFGADITLSNDQIKLTNKNVLTATNIHVPGDISSAAFFMVAATIVPNSKLTLKNIGLNETRTGILDVLAMAGVNVTIANKRTVAGEQIGDITITGGQLRPIVIEGDLIPRLIDEIPIIALMATQIEGTTIIRDAEELKVKETDRIAAVVDVLTTLGANIEATNDGMIIRGKSTLTGSKVASYNDHRIAMMIAIASLIANGPVTIDDTSSIAISYPSFFKDLERIMK